MKLTLIQIVATMLFAGSIAAPTAPVTDAGNQADGYSLRDKWTRNAEPDVVADGYSLRNKWTAVAERSAEAEAEPGVAADNYSLRNKWTAVAEKEKREAEAEPVLPVADCRSLRGDWKNKHRQSKPLLAVSKVAPVKNTFSGRPNLWADLTHREIESLERYLHSTSTGLNLTAYKYATHTDNYVLVAELLRPNKTDVLQFLDLDGAKVSPPRFARVTVNRQSIEAPQIEEYVVGPLPVTSETMIQPLTYIYNSGRSSTKVPTPEPAALLAWFDTIGDKIADILEDLLAFPVTGSQEKSSVRERFEVSSNDRVFYEGNLTMRWVGFFQISNASTLLAQGLYFKADTTGRDPKQWNVVSWLYNDIVYHSTQEFRAAWMSADFQKLPGNFDGEWTSLEPDPRFENEYRSNNPPPVFSQIGESRIRIDEEESFISWMGVEFNFAFSQVNGISLFDIRLEGERIIYELGLQEAMAHYAGSDPLQSGTAFLDSLFGMGTRLSELVPGFDCPSYAHFFDTTYYRSDERYTHPRTVCLFEAPTDYPLQRHSQGRTTTSFTNSYLILRTIAVIGNYDYMIDYIFYLDGTIEVKVCASGYIQGAYWPNTTRTEYGYHLHDSFSSSIHDHVLNFKADLDIGGRENSMSVVTVAEKQTQYPWSSGQTINTMHLQQSYIENEDDASINWPPNSASMYIVVGPENGIGERRGYRVMPGTGVGSPVHLTIKNSTDLLKSAEWAKSDFFVTRQKDTEPRSASPVNALTPEDPLIRFDRFLDGESLVEEDLVIWFNLGNHHVPHTGDLPNTLMTTSASSVMFAPHNYHVRDRARALTNGIRIEAKKKGIHPEVKLFGNFEMMPNLTSFTGDVEHVRKFPVRDDGVSL